MAISMLKIEEEHILRVLPVLLKRDEQFRGSVYAILSETFATKDDLKQIIEVMNKRFEEVNKRFEDINKRFEEHREETNRRFEEINQRFETIDKKFEAMDQRFVSLIEEMHLGFTSIREELHFRLTTIGSRWGKRVEATFRNTLKELLTRKLEAKEVKKWECYDEEGRVFSIPSYIEADIVIKNGKHSLMEIKSTADKSDVGTFERIARFYKEEINITPCKILVAIEIDEYAKELCEKLGIEVFTYEELKVYS
ncbi:MAG: DUF892 family protein [bacterium]